MRGSFILAFAAISLLSTAAGAWTLDKTKGAVKPAKAGQELKAGDEVSTGADGRALIKDGESEIWLAPSSRLVFRKVADVENDQLGRFDLVKGSLRARFKRPAGPEDFPYQIGTRTLLIGRGQEFFVAVEEKEEVVRALEGLVRVSSEKSSGEGWDVAAAKGLVVHPGEMPKVKGTSAAQKKSAVEATSF